MTRPSTRTESWRAYLDWFHEGRSGITEDILTEALLDEDGTTAYNWLLSTCPKEGLRLDVACGSGPLLLRGYGGRSVGIDWSAGELARAAGRTSSPLVRGNAAALPFPDKTFSVVVCSMAIMLFNPVDLALAEIRRVLRTAGTVLFLVPGSRPLTARDRMRYVRVLYTLHEFRPAYPNYTHLGTLQSRLERAGFVVLEDDRRRYSYPLRDEPASRRFIESLYTPGCPPKRTDAAVRVATSWVGSEIGIPLRRLVCQKQAT